MLTHTDSMNALIEFLQEKKVVAFAEIEIHLHQKGAKFAHGVDLVDIICEMQRLGSLDINLQSLQISYHDE